MMFFINKGVGRDMGISTDSNTVKEYQHMTIYHKHHIVPRYMGGSDDPSNLTELTIEEHAEAHRKLFEQYGHWQDELAWKGLAGMITNQEAIRQSLIMAGKSIKGIKRSTETKKKMSENNVGMRGLKHSVESKIKMSESKKGKSQTDIWIKNRSESLNGRIGGFVGKSHSEETRNKMREAAKQRWAKTTIGKSNV